MLKIDQAVMSKMKNLLYPNPQKTSLELSKVEKLEMKEHLNTKWWNKNDQRAKSHRALHLLPHLLRPLRLPPKLRAESAVKSND